MTFKELCEQLEAEIINAYETGVSLDEAEKLAAKFLHGQLEVSEQLSAVDLNARMRKSGLKAVRGAVYVDIKSKGDKLTVDALEHQLNMNELVAKEQDELDSAEVERDKLRRSYDVFMNAHIYFRGVAKGGGYNG